ncbi:hypothetical protein [Natronoglycomyces albus]|uniref:Uncharacterized protein n=1 Tax=Natronoglycomyces albus TaxID=2811108 RepID=A0A895XMN6_9ACTN|nr:hypothetical protein [Natronoglycomyces albus]QSB06387.1 hypothetical protein JQS30_05610 [Natronoglycomyces albus]
MHKQTRSARIGATLLTSAALLTACSGNDSAEDHGSAISQEDLDRISTAMADVNTTSGELRILGSRLMNHCMENYGFDVHPQLPRTNFDDDFVFHALPGTPPLDSSYLVSPETAREEGFGIFAEWTDVTAEDYIHPDMADSNPDFLARGREYADQYFYVQSGREPAEDSIQTMEEFLESLEAEPESAAGCGGEVASWLYADETPGLEDVNPEDITYRGPEPPVPDGVITEAWKLDFPTPEANQAMERWNDCLEERGNSRIKELGSIPPYVRSFYVQPPGTDDEGSLWWTGEGSDPGYMPAPSWAPLEFDEAAEREIALAVDVAECSEETDFKATLQHEWDQMLGKMAIEHEAALYVWRDQMEAALVRAQEVLAE